MFKCIMNISKNKTYEEIVSYISMSILNSNFNEVEKYVSILKREGVLGRCDTGFIAKAVKEGNEDMVSLLAGLGVSLNKRDLFGNSPLDNCFCCERPFSMLFTLLRYPINIDDNNNESKLTSLNKFCMRGAYGLINVLLSQGARTDFCDIWGRVPLYNLVCYNVDFDFRLFEKLVKLTPKSFLIRRDINNESFIEYIGKRAELYSNSFNLIEKLQKECSYE